MDGLYLGEKDKKDFYKKLVNSLVTKVASKGDIFIEDEEYGYFYNEKSDCELYQVDKDLFEEIS